MEQGDRDKKGSSYQGATVLEPVRGIHANVAVLDFASLYPSIMMAYNLCFSTLVADRHQRGLDLRGALFYQNCVFVGPEVRKGIIPVILERLVATRKKCKIEMETTTDPLLYYLLDCRQMALKISCNSIYGYVGSKFAMLSEQLIAETVTGGPWAVSRFAPPHLIAGRRDGAPAHHGRQVQGRAAVHRRQGVLQQRPGPRRRHRLGTPARAA